MPHVFGLVHTYHDLKNAEYEVLQRILIAAKRIGALTVVLDRDGKILWASPELSLTEGIILPDGIVDFVLAMHFESSRVLDVYSYVTLWQPIEFYHIFGYQKSIDKVTTYNDLISCASVLADAHGLNLLTGLGRAPLLPLPQMFHTLPEPFLAPRISAESTLFYIGINWERIGRPKGRFHDTLVSLDQKLLTDIYGPELMLGVAPWEGFNTYRGELPFDGEAVKNAVNRSGICLVLSSAAHKNAGIMSNRLFEGLAGGAAIIATPNALIDKYFAEAVYIVDDTRGEEHLGLQILEVLRKIRADPDEATRRTLIGQEILRTTCSLERSIAALFEGNATRIAHFEAQFLAATRVSVVLTFFGNTIEAFAAHIAQFARQRQARVVVHVICGRRFAERNAASLAAAASDAIERLVVHPVELDSITNTFDGAIIARQRTGPVVAAILKQIDTPLFAFSGAGDWVFSDHFASLAKILDDEPTALAACSGMIRQTKGIDAVETRTLDSARFVDFDSIVLVNGSGQVGRFAFRADLLLAPFDHLMPLLDGEEHAYFRLAGFLGGPLAQTNYASYVYNEAASTSVPSPEEPLEHQRQAIRDLFARDPRWLDRLHKGGRIPEFVYAMSPGVPVRWQEYRAPRSITNALPLDTPAPTRIGGRGLDMLGDGFSYPETDGIWLQSERGRIEFNLPPVTPDRAEDREIVLVAEGRRSLQNGREQHVTVAINGMVVAYEVVPDHESELRIRIPIQMTNTTQTYHVDLTPDHAEMVYDAEGAVTDSRRLSIRLRSVGVFRRGYERSPVLAVGKDYSCGQGTIGSQTLVSNFYPAERQFAWIAGVRAVVFFYLDRVPETPKLCVGLRGRRLIEPGRPPRVTLTANGVTLGEFQLDEGDNDLEIDLSNVDLSGRSVELFIAVDRVEAVYDSGHNIIDNRLISVALARIGLYEASSPDSLPPPPLARLKPGSGWRAKRLRLSWSR